MEKKTLGKTIAILRKQRAMTQLELAEKVGVTDKAVSKWERDLSCPDVHLLPKLAEIFDISVDELMQVEPKCKTKDQKGLQEITDIALRAIALAMGIAVGVLAVLNKLDTQSGLIMLGIGLACGAASSFCKISADD